MAGETLDNYQQVEVLIADHQVHRDDERQHSPASVRPRSRRRLRARSVPAFAVLSFMAMIGTEATLHYSMRALEHEIQARISGLERLPFPYMFAIMGVTLASIVTGLTAYSVDQIEQLVVPIAVGTVCVCAGLLIPYATALGRGGLDWEQRIWEDPGLDLEIGLWNLNRPGDGPASERE